MPDAAPIAHLDAAFLADLRRVIHERDADCPHCGYSLCGVPGPRCPECGRNVTEHLRLADTRPAVIRRMRLERSVRRTVAVAKAALYGGLAAALAIAALRISGAL